MKRQLSISYWIITLLSALFVSGCDYLHDDQSECHYYLKFKYDYNLFHSDLFAEQVEEVAVYLFDANRRYVTTYTQSGEVLKQNGYKMELPYTAKGGILVTWAGRTADCYELPTLLPGDPIEKLTLTYCPEGDISQHCINDLWHSGPSQATFAEEDGLTQSISLIRNTNDLYFKLSNRNGEPLDLSHYNVTITAANSAYDHTNNYLPQCPTIAYLPHSMVSDEQQTAQFRLMRFVEGDNTQLSLTEKSTGRVITIAGSNSLSLVPYLLNTRPASYGNQEYLDRRYIWDITLTIDADNYMALCININGWIKWFQKVDM